MSWILNVKKNMDYIVIYNVVIQNRMLIII